MSYVSVCEAFSISLSTYADKLSAHQEDPNYKLVLPNYSYLGSTANNNLRTHLESFHEQEYVDICVENSWVMQLPKRKRRQELAKASLQQSVLDGIVMPSKATHVLFLGTMMT